MKAILRRTERAILRAKCGWKVVDRKTTDGHAGLEKTVDGLATANRATWYEHVLRRNDGSVLRVTPDFEGSGKRKRGRQKTWKKQVERWNAKNGGKEMNPAISAKGEKPDKNRTTTRMTGFIVVFYY